MTKIERKNTSARMSQIVMHGDTVYLAGQVGTPGGKRGATNSRLP